MKKAKKGDTIIIPFFPTHSRDGAKKIREIEPLVNAAWDFARCALWPEQHFSYEDTEATKHYIRKYFKAATVKKRAFTALCQRVILTQKYISKSAERYVPMPYVWFNRRFPFGFAGTLSWLYNVERQRKEVPGYLAHIEALADGYYAYAVKPNEKMREKCMETLLCFHAPSLLQLFCAITTSTNNQRA